jgi:hypothetical protein
MTTNELLPGSKVKCSFATSRSTIERTVTITAVNADGTFAGTIRVNGRVISYPAIEASRIVK